MTAQQYSHKRQGRPMKHNNMEEATESCEAARTSATMKKRNATLAFAIPSVTLAGTDSLGIHHNALHPSKRKKQSKMIWKKEVSSTIVLAVKSKGEKKSEPEKSMRCIRYTSVCEPSTTLWSTNDDKISSRADRNTPYREEQVILNTWPNKHHDSSWFCFFFSNVQLPPTCGRSRNCDRNQPWAYRESPKFNLSST